MLGDIVMKTTQYFQYTRQRPDRVFILRVILLEDGETVHNAFFDRDFKE